MLPGRRLWITSLVWAFIDLLWVRIRILILGEQMDVSSACISWRCGGAQFKTFWIEAVLVSCLVSAASELDVAPATWRWHKVHGHMRRLDVSVQGMGGDADLNGQDKHGKSDRPGWVRLLERAYTFTAGLQRWPRSVFCCWTPTYVTWSSCTGWD